MDGADYDTDSDEDYGDEGTCTFLCALVCSYLQSFSKINITVCCGFKKS
jgi:hypothetical protein